MVGRGWWVLVWTVCAGWCVVCAGLTCQPGQEFFSGQQGQCVPCTRCHDPQVVVVPCYVYQDAVCAPAAQFVPNWSQPGRPQLPITLSTSPAPHTKDAHVHNRQKPGTQSDREMEEPKKSLGNQEKSHGSKSSARENNISAKDGAIFFTQDDSETSEKEHPQHNHRHRHRQHLSANLRPRIQSIEQEAQESEVNSVVVLDDSGAGSALDEQQSEGDTGVPRRDSDGIEPDSRNNGNGANTSDKMEENDSEQPEAAGWKETFFFAAIIVVSISLVGLTIVTLSHLRNMIARRKLKRLYDGVLSESTGEARVMEQLLPSAPDGRAPVVASRGTVTYIRATTATPSTPSSPTITTTATMSVEAHRTSGHAYPLNPFTMDRLLEQRRVLGPASSVDTNLYIESWQQQDSQLVGHMAIGTQSQCLPLRGSVSACPSPTPVRTYRIGPASASASPTVSLRGLNITRGHMRGGGFVSPACTVSGTGAGGCS